MRGCCGRESAGGVDVACESCELGRHLSVDLFVQPVLSRQVRMINQGYFAKRFLLLVPLSIVIVNYMDLFPLPIS